MIEEKERYIGSVRFYKHVILGIVGLAILVPCCVSICLGVQNRTLIEHQKEMLAKQRETEAELDSLRQKTEEAEILDTHKDNPLTASGELAREDWKLILVNESHPLSTDFEVNLVSVSGGQRVDTRIKEPLEKMLKDMRTAGLHPVVCSSYRSLEKQSRLFDEYIEGKQKAGWNYEDAFFKAKKRIAQPGTSEHHTGLALDIVGQSHQSLDDAQARTKEALWLSEHCDEYGFILRYPEGKTDVTGIEYESWHFRYVGEEAASYIMEHGITLEEYLEAVDK